MISWTSRSNQECVIVLVQRLAPGSDLGMLPWRATRSDSVFIFLAAGQPGTQIACNEKFKQNNGGRGRSSGAHRDIAENLQRLPDSTQTTDVRLLLLLGTVVSTCRHARCLSCTVNISFLFWSWRCCPGPRVSGSHCALQYCSRSPRGRASTAMERTVWPAVNTSNRSIETHERGVSLSPCPWA
jgi:hypothetical protein